MFSKTVHHILIVTVAVGFHFLFIGCGSEDSQPKDPKVSEKKSNEIRKKTKSGPAPAPKATKKKTQKKTAKKTPKIKANPEDIFVVTDPVPNYEIMDTNLKQNSTFRATPPADEYGLSSYRIIKIASTKMKRPRNSLELPEGFSALPEFGFTEEGIPLRIVCEVDDSEMAYISGGVAVVGSQDGPSETRPVLAVELDPYYIDVNEVTIEQFQRFLKGYKKGGSKNKADPTNPDDPTDHPVLGIKWHEARKYGLWTGKKLPTETQWERAARGTEGYLHIWGNGRPTWHRPRNPNQIDPVQSFPCDTTEEGVFDMAGNAMEWCRDIYRTDAFEQATKKAAGTVLKNWTGPKTAQEKGVYVIKGNGPNWETWNRAGQTRAQRSPKVGFRCVLELTKEKEDDSRKKKKK